MKILTNIIIISSLILFFTLSSCINDSEVINEDKLENSTLIESEIEVVETKEVEIIEDTVIKEPKVEKKIEKKIIKVQPKEIKKQEVSDLKMDVEVAKKKEEIILSDSIDLSTDRNQSYNPDNANAPVELSIDSSVKLKPIFSDSDMSKYYVVFKESNAKINRKEISKLVKVGQIVYVANYQGIYKYCVGQSNNENEAIVFKAVFDKQQGNTSSTVSTFSSAW